ncbi:hypothetical protein F5B19DRAFT_498651 [Rostrohypoxylon terebratum]|nr:hypothetical protein F5B19DRAFT_498651 [Rostrohypoxylon terebratum]
MSRELLNDAAIVLHRIFSNENIKYGIFGGHAISAFGGVRVTKDIDVLASVSKDELLKLVTKEHGFDALTQARDDYVAFLYAEKAALKFQVLVEVFCVKFKDSQYTMDDISTTAIPIRGLYHGPGLASFLDPPYLFKGKLHAAATRSKLYDAADLRALVARYKDDIASHTNTMNIKDIGLAIKRHPELVFLFRQLDIDINKAERAARFFNPNEIKQPIAAGAIQSGLLS